MLLPWTLFKRFFYIKYFRSIDFCNYEYTGQEITGSISINLPQGEYGVFLTETNIGNVILWDFTPFESTGGVNEALQSETEATEKEVVDDCNATIANLIGLSRSSNYAL